LIGIRFFLYLKTLKKITTSLFCKINKKHLKKNSEIVWTLIFKSLIILRFMLRFMKLNLTLQQAFTKYNKSFYAKLINGTLICKIRPTPAKGSSKISLYFVRI